MPPWLTELVKLLGDKAGFITPAITYGGVTFGFFHWLDKKASPAAKKAFTEWLRPVPHDSRDIVNAGLELFDRLYSTPLLSISAFLRSSVFTIIMFCIFLYEFDAPAPYNYDSFHREILGFSYEASLIINILSDYTSLFVVRRWLSAGKDKIKTLLIGPAVGIIVVGLFQLFRDVVFFALADYRYLGAADLIETPLEVATELIEFVILIWTFPEWVATAISALAVHLWLPILVLSVGLLKALNYFRKAVGWTQWFVKGGKQHPLDAVGYVAAVIVFATTVTLQRIFS